jgi:hypothetical protein
MEIKGALRPELHPALLGGPNLGGLFFFFFFFFFSASLRVLLGHFLYSLLFYFSPHYFRKWETVIIEREVKYGQLARNSFPTLDDFLFLLFFFFLLLPLSPLVVFVIACLVFGSCIS